MSRMLPEIYDARFDEREVSAKDAIWREIVRFLQRYIDPERADHGPRLRSRPLHPLGRRRPSAGRRDIRDMRSALPDDVRFVQSSGLDLAADVPNGYFGTVFMSNYLEHLESSDAVIDQLRVARQLLRPGGRVIVLQPNIRLVGAALLGLHRSQGRADRAEPGRGGRAGRAADRRAHHALPAVFDEGSPAGRPAARPRVPGVPAGLAADGAPDAARLRGPRMTAPELSIVMPVFKEGEAVEPVIRAITAGRAHAARGHRRLRLRRGPDGPGHQPAGRRAPGGPRPSQRPGTRGAQRDEGRDRGRRRRVRADHDVRRLGRAPHRRLDGRARERRRRRRGGLALHARRAPGRRPDLQAAR